MHTRHWTEQPEARVDANVNNLVVYRAEGVIARAVLEMRFLNQPAGATVQLSPTTFSERNSLLLNAVTFKS